MDAPLAWTEPSPFRWPDETLDALEPRLTGRLIAAAGDIALAVDPDGTIRDLSLGHADLAAEGAGEWVGRSWADTVTPESRVKLAEMLQDRVRPRRWRQVTHLMKNGRETPVRYMAVDVRGDGRIIAVGRDMRAAAALQQRLIQSQQAMERDHLRLRQAEARYRMLFELSGEAMLILDADTRRIVEANSAAERLAGLGPLTGQAYTAIAQERDREPAIAALGAASAVERASPAPLRLAADGRRVEAAATLFRQGRQNFFLVRLSEGAASREASPIGALIDRVPDPFVLTDSGMEIVAANAAFLEITGFARSEDIAGRAVADFLGRPGIDAALIAAQLREHGSLRKFETVVTGRFGTQDEVEVSAVAAPDGDSQVFGFTLRTAPNRREVPVTNLDQPGSIEQLTHLVGRMSLKDIVRESTDLIEKLCIEAALKYTQDNRANAAEILGLSRQGLYSKLNRFGMARAGAEEAE